jgi:PAS domain S-box-containing protein
MKQHSIGSSLEDKHPVRPLHLSNVALLELLDSLSAAAYTCGPEGLIISFNSRAAELWGRTPKVNNPEDMFCGSHKLFLPDGSPVSHDQCWMARALRENKQFNGCEILIERPDGNRLTALAHANPIYDKSGTLVGAVNVLIDIGNRKRAVDNLRNGDCEQDELLAAIAHELRNPLVPIRNAIEYLRAPQIKATLVRRATDIIAAQVNQLTHLIDDLLDLGRIARGTYKVRKTHIDFSVAVKEVAEILRPAIEAKGHDLKVSVPSEPIIVDADPVRISQIVNNLLDNASKYTDSAGYVSVELSVTENSAVLDVHDSGIGISSDLLPNIFDPFIRADKSQRQSRGGLGLGLSITKTLVEMHGGQVSVVTRPGNGSTFTVRLPIARAVETQAVSPAPLKPTRRRILVVDDNVAVADSFATLLESMGHEVSIVLDGRSAITSIAALAPHVVFIDINLPDIDGYTLACKLRQEHSVGQALLVAVTGYGQSQDNAQLQQAVFDYYLKKPVDIDDLGTIFS